ncbi:hypothetical protein [Psychromonas sp.]|uniref:hypothetical protein n=1 Tax=Psychromonas sp. TaxID=1884585 RepID=UPI00356414B9
MKNYTNEEIKLAVYKQNDEQIIATLTSLAAKNELEQHEEVVRSCLRDVLAERHGPSEVEHIETLIEKKIVA